MESLGLSKCRWSYYVHIWIIWLLFLAWIPFDFFPFLAAVARALGTSVEWKWGKDCSFHIPDLRERTFRSFPLHAIPLVSFLAMALVCWAIIPSVPHVFSACVMPGGWIPRSTFLHHRADTAFVCHPDDTVLPHLLIYIC